MSPPPKMCLILALITPHRDAALGEQENVAVPHCATAGDIRGTRLIWGGREGGEGEREREGGGGGVNTV